MCPKSVRPISILTCFMFLLWHTLLLVFYSLSCYFSTVLLARACTVMRACTLYHSAYVAQVRSHLSFFKLVTDTRSEAGHETCSSSWSCYRNFFSPLKLLYFFWLMTCFKVLNFLAILAIHEHIV